MCSHIVPRCRLTKDERGKPADATYYRKMVGSLKYVLAIRLDLAYSVCLVARYMEILNDVHLDAVRRSLRYLRGYVNLDVLYNRSDMLELQNYQIQTMKEIVMTRKTLQAICSCMVQDKSLGLQRNNLYLLYLPLKLNLLQQPHVLVKAYGFKTFFINTGKLRNMVEL